MELNYSKMRWKINEVPLEKDIATVFPDLADIFRDYKDNIEGLGISIDIFIRYTVYCYHQFSPLVTDIEDIFQRKKIALQQAGADGKNYDTITGYKSEHVCYAIINFLKFENSTRHMELVLQKEALFKSNFDLAKGKKIDTKTIDWLRDSIEHISNIHFKGDIDMDNFVPSFNTVENRKIYPEQYADTELQELQRLRDEVGIEG